MVGRDRELARVTELLGDALAGRGRLVLCAGEAGIGKTRLAEEIAVSAAAGGVAGRGRGVGLRDRPGQLAAVRPVAAGAG
jgi:ATP-dependent Clp protease ATP-binding subunit ClpA